MALTPKQKHFVKEYLIDKNATRAAKAAGYSAKTANASGPRLLLDVRIQAEIQKGLALIHEKAELKAADVLAEIKKLAFVNLAKAYDEEGNLLPLHKMPEDVQAALAGLETDELIAGSRGMKRKVGKARKVKLFDKVRSLEMLAKHFKLFVDPEEDPNKGAPQIHIHMPSNAREVKK